MRHSGDFKPAGQEPRRGKGGARPGAGAPTKEQREAKKIAAEVVRQRIEADAEAIAKEYVRLAKGGKVKKGSSPQTIRHAVERWLPAARQGIDVNLNNSPDEMFRALEAAKRARQERLGTIISRN